MKWWKRFLETTSFQLLPTRAELSSPYKVIGTTSDGVDILAPHPHSKMTPERASEIRVAVAKALAEKDTP